MGGLPSGTVTFLFTDIEGSTRMWREYASDMPAAYARHDQILHDAIASEGGNAFKTVGDAFQVVFPTAVGAARAAIAAQQALTTQEWHLPEPLRVRMALHTGAVEPTADGDYRSPVLNRLGRLLDAGHGGQILVSSATAGLVRDALPADAALVNLGPHRLKDLERAEEIFQVVAPSLIREFAALISLDTRPNNLPVQVNRYIGRQDDLEAVRALLLDADARLVTLTGPGGMGKTRLSLQVAAGLLDVFEDGVFVVNLDVLSDTRLVPAAIAEVFGLREEPGTKIMQTIVQFLRRRTLLLVLDNMEHVIEAASDVGELLTACPGLKVLATSRARLQLRSEVEYRLRPLVLPGSPDAPDASCESMQLFLDRARAAQSSFTITPDNAPAIAEICAQLDGLPLAIELAAARIRMLPPRAMLRRLSDRLPLLTGGARDLPERQRTLRSTIAWSYDLLTPEDQQLFRKLAVFPAGACVDAIEAVAPGLDVFNGLERLVDHSLVRQNAEGEEPRFSLFETIREFARAELDRNEETDEAFRRHAHFLAGFFDVDYFRVTGDDYVSWGERVSAEFDNLRAVLEWSLAHDAELACRLVANSGRCWRQRGAIREGKKWANRTLALDLDHVPERFRGQLLRAAGSFWIDEGHLDSDFRMLEEAIDIFERLDEPFELSIALTNYGGMATFKGDCSLAIRMDERAVEVARTSGDEYLLAFVLNNYGVSLCNEGRFDDARSAFSEALAFVQEREIPIMHYVILNSLGDLHLAQGEVEQAERRYCESLAGPRQILEGVFVSANLISLAVLAARDGRYARAARLAGADARITRIRDSEMVGELLDLEDDYEQCLAATKAALGNEVFRQLWNEGAAMSLDSVSEAVGEHEGLNALPHMSNA